MSDKEEGNGAVVEGKTQMAEAEEPQKQQQQDESKKPGKINISLSIWPPTQRTRDAVINRLVETLSTPSILSKRYGVIPSDEAASAARLIEEEAFSTAASAAAANTDEDDGMEILQVYSKEISKRMLEAVKSRASSDSAPNPPQIPDAADAAASATDETPSVEAESS